ncbi:alpha-ribazole-5-phosphate phosphatase [Hyphomicrobium nitrativorans NL23]|uniref:Alpha-ribazole-5-phosphate phosphatase n=1 Tax=Hyphomicrobium nitrativorans NL23 TaxID=1029756 RepID=V5SDC0_9HYPH|nr:histidine phosphatase family protein [Hyphomicrobium nitrativorans]AHB48487.1 alpha-ribazole-5-phosphate phosphatase [Hyphomicrobium nitrativorans NL23]
MRLDLIRHGRTNMPGVLLGRTDAAATDASAADLIRQTEGRIWSAIVATPLRRSHAFAERLARDRGLPLRIDSDWRELDFGDWDGKPIEELRADPVVAAHLDAFYRDAEAPAPPGGESWRMLEARTLRALNRLLDADPAESTLVVAHGGPIRATLSLACGLPFASTWAFRVDYATRITLEIGRGAGAKIWGEIVEVAQP